MSPQKKELPAYAKNIKRLREARGWSQPELGKILGVTFTHISKWETGTIAPGSKHLSNLARAFGVTESTILGTSTGAENVNIEDLAMWLNASEELKQMMRRIASDPDKVQSWYKVLSAIEDLSEDQRESLLGLIGGNTRKG